jgi:hypothetical protein
MKKNIFKKLLISFVCICFIATTNAQIKVPKAVENAFKTKFTNAQEVKWGKENKNEYEADFKMEGKTYSANFLKNGQWKETESEISITELPESVKKSYNIKHSNAAIKIISKIETATGNLQYEIEYKAAGKTKELVYNDQGIIIK